MPGLRSCCPSGDQKAHPLVGSMRLGRGDLGCSLLLLSVVNQIPTFHWEIVGEYLTPRSSSRVFGYPRADAVSIGLGVLSGPFWR